MTGGPTPFGYRHRSDSLHPAWGTGSPTPGINNYGTFNGPTYQAENQYIQQLYQQRESFIAQVAATRTKARWLTWLGALVTIAALAVFAFTFATLPDTFSSPNPANGFPQAFKVMFPALAVGVVGQILLIVGIVLHVVATARKRRVDMDPRYRALPPNRPN